MTFGNGMHASSIRSRALGALTALFALAIALPASALYVDFADYQGAESGNQANITAHGLSITIDSHPTNFDLSISDSGLGVRCTLGRWGCLTNQSNQIDAEWAESIVITFNDGPVRLNSVDLSRIYRGEIAVVATENQGQAVVGSGYNAATAKYNVDMGGVIASRFVVASWGWFSDASLQGMDFDLLGAPVVPVPPTPGGGASPIPEPSAALLFVAGFATAVTRRRRA